MPALVQAALGRLIIPRLGLNVVFRQGTKPGVLAKGPGHYPTSGLPGEGRTIGIAGHRVTHTRPFLRLNTMRMRIIPQRQTWPLRSGTTEQVVITACHPPRTALRRIAVFARLVSH